MLKKDLWNIVGEKRRKLCLSTSAFYNLGNFSKILFLVNGLTFTTQSRLSTTSIKGPFKNIVRKEENAGDHNVFYFIIYQKYSFSYI